MTLERDSLDSINIAADFQMAGDTPRTDKIVSGLRAGAIRRMEELRGAPDNSLFEVLHQVQATLVAHAQTLERERNALRKALNRMLREHDILSTCNPLHVDQWPEAAKQARDAIRGLDSQ